MTNFPASESVGKCGCWAMQSFLQVGKHREHMETGRELTALKWGAPELYRGLDTESIDTCSQAHQCDNILHNIDICWWLIIWNKERIIKSSPLRFHMGPALKWYGDTLQLYRYTWFIYTHFHSLKSPQKTLVTAGLGDIKICIYDTQVKTLKVIPHVKVCLL